MNLNIDSVLRQTMTRKQFLQYTGSAMLALFGVSSVLKALQSSNTTAAKRRPMGYGGSAYGGR